MKDIVNFINNNKSWIFDGIGVTIIVSVFGIISFTIKTVLNKKKETKNSKTFVQRQNNRCFSQGEQIMFQNNYHEGDKKEKDDSK